MSDNFLKIYNGVAMTPRSTDPSNPTDGDLQFSDGTARTEGLWQYFNGDWQEMGGGGSGSGGINYTPNSNFEADVTGWTGDTNISIAHETVAPLRDLGSLKVTKSAINASTQTLNTSTFTVDSADLAKKLTVSFDYDFSDADYSDGDARLQITQDPDGSPSTIRVNGEDIKAGKGTHYAQFQTDSTEDQYQLELYWVSTGTTEVIAYMDNVQIGPTNLAFGAIITDTESYTPTFGGLGTVISKNFVYSRVGEKIHVSGTATIGTPSGSPATISLPPGLSVASSLGSAVSILGRWTTNSSVASNYKDFDIIANNTSGNTLGLSAVEFAIAASPLTTQAGNSIVAGGLAVSFNFSVSIEGWSSNAQMSEDLGGRDVAVTGAGNAGESITANATNINFAETADTTSSWNGEGFTAPESGYYIMSGIIQLTTNISTVIASYKDAVFKHRIGEIVVSESRGLFQDQIYLNKGEEWSVRITTSATLSNSAGSHWIQINKLASPQTILETETVAGLFTDSSGQTVNSTESNLGFNTVVKDTHGAWNGTDTYVVPVSGTYAVAANYLAGSMAMGAGNAVRLHVRVNATNIAEQFWQSPATVTIGHYIDTYVLLDVEKGDFIIIRAACDISNTISTSTNYNKLSIHRIK